MLSPAAFVDDLKKNGFGFFTGVPDSLLKDLCAYIDDTLPPSDHVITANEGNAVALATGRYLGTGKTSVVYMQNSGLGNTINPLTSIADPEVYGIPMMLLVGWRGEPGVKDEPQHVKQGRVTPDMLKTLEVPTWVIDADCDAAKIIAEAAEKMRQTSAPVALLIRGGTFDAFPKKKKGDATYPLRREEGLQKVVSQLDKDTIVVATTGHISRELYEYRMANGGDGSTDFLTVGGMGHTASIALGIALSRPDKKVVCLDGDGSLLMHMGMAPIIGKLAPKNLVHVVLNNGAHESVGGQPTVAFDFDLPAVAKACGYKAVLKAQSEDEIAAALRSATSQDGPVFIELRVSQGARKDLGRPKSTPQQNRDALMKRLGSA